jgi:hypothetical protein
VVSVFLDDLSRLGQEHFPVAHSEHESFAQLAFQLLDLLADGGLGDVQFLSGPASR